ncbi:hypothetical protein FHY04_001197 [Sphingomonas sp. BK481]|jgi:alpha-galactosidase|nr:hypothetical protein [Sphingomonas sp. BK481]MBB3586347.1 hypothetical protein [Sphingomonas sp. BK481]
MGGDLRHLDRLTLDLLTNPKVIAVNQASYDNQPQFVTDNTRVWSARGPRSNNRYLALFNTDNKARAIRVPLNRLGLRGSFALVICGHGAGSRPYPPT